MRIVEDSSLTITDAARRAFESVSGRFLLFVTPVFAASLSFRALIWSMDRMFPGKHVWTEGALLFLICMPLEFFAEAVVATMYLRILQGKTVGLALVLTVTSYPGFASLIARLTGMCALWILPTFAVATIVSISLQVFNHLFRPHVSLSLTARGGGHLWTMLWVVLYVSLVSRYSFVMPMLAVRRSGGAATFRAAVQTIKGLWRFFALLGIAEYLAVHFASQWAKRASVWHGGRPTALLAEIFFSSVLTTYVAAFKTDLLAQSVEINPLSPSQVIS